jgi:putative copper resistance protein D
VDGLPSPTLRTMALPAQLDVVALILVGTSAWVYVAGVRRLAARGRRWRPARTASFLGGLALIAVATQTGIARYDTALFSVHVAQHVMLSMVAPVLLVLGAPVTLALQACGGTTARTLRRLLHAHAAGILTHPVATTAAFSLSLFVLYLSPLFELSLRNDVVHAWVHLHLVAVGCLFAAAVVGIDPLPVRWPHPLRLLLVGLTVPAHAILGLIVLSGPEPLAADWYGEVQRDWGGTPLGDQRLGAGILWAAGELVAVALALLVVAQWMRHSEREARRADLRLDRALRGAT